MHDLISRQAAIDAFKKELTVGESKGNYVTICSAVGYEGAKQILERLPSVERKKGEWMVEDIYGSVSCSVCGCALEDWIQGAFYNFCPYCGADMRGEQNDND